MMIFTNDLIKYNGKSFSFSIKDIKCSLSPQQVDFYTDMNENLA